MNQKKGRSQKMKIGHGGGFLKKKSMTNKKKVSIVESIAGTSFDSAESGPQAHNFMNHSL